MRNEVVQQGEKAAIAGVGALATIGLSEISSIVAIGVGLATFCYVLAQLAFLLRKWWLLEKAEHRPKWDSTK